MRINVRQLEFRCKQNSKQLLDGKRYKFIDNGGSVLAVAHVDVHPGIRNPKFFVRKGRNVVFSPALDDRLGVYILLDLLPELGIKVDVLLTDDEEIGRSTASMFTGEKQYNWMFQFDRRGTDVVMYQYDTPELRQLLEGFDFEVGFGSFSDICYLDHLGCAGFNFGTGYYNEHSMQCYANLRHLTDQLNRFERFFARMSEVELIYTDSLGFDDTPFWNTPFNEDEVCCDVCGTNQDVTYFYDADSFVCVGCEYILPEIREYLRYVSRED